MKLSKVEIVREALGDLSDEQCKIIFEHYLSFQDMDIGRLISQSIHSYKDDIDEVLDTGNTEDRDYEDRMAHQDDYATGTG